MITVYPLGHPVQIETASREAEEIAVRRWGTAARVFDVEPLQFSICAFEGATAGALEFAPTADGFRFVANGCLAEFDYKLRHGCIRATCGLLEHMMEATILTALTWTFFIGVHAACVMRNGQSVLLCGDSEAGKSTLAFGCGLAGWTVVSDNSLYWAPAPHDVLISPGTPVKLREGARALFGPKAEACLTMATVAPPGPFVFLSRRAGKAEARPSRECEALAYLRKYDTRPDREHAEDRYRALLRHGLWTLEYEHVEDAVECLGSLT